MNTIQVYKIVLKQLTKCLAKTFKLIKHQVPTKVQLKYNLTTIAQPSNILLLQMLMVNLNLKLLKMFHSYLTA
jgi:hypothetical protein